MAAQLYNDRILDQRSRVGDGIETACALDRCSRFSDESRGMRVVVYVYVYGYVHALGRH